jgi:hypothetical protein
MDDPLIGLTIFDSRQKPSPSGPGRPVSSTSENKRSRRSESVDSNKLQEEKGSKRERSVDKETRTDSKNDPSRTKTSGTGSKTSSKAHGGKKANSGGKGKPTKGSDIGGDLDKCFPCLPGIEEPPEKEEGEEMSDGQSLSCSGESTPTSPLPHNEPTENHVDSSYGGGMGTLAIDTSPSTPIVDSNILMNSPVPQPQNYWLMRLFQSKLFDMSIAIGYLFNTKDSDVQAYLGNKLFVSMQCTCTCPSTLIHHVNNMPNIHDYREIVCNCAVPYCNQGRTF